MAGGKSPESGMHSRIAKEQGWQKLGQAKKPSGKLSGLAGKVVLSAAAIFGGSAGVKGVLDQGSLGEVTQNVSSAGENTLEVVKNVQHPDTDSQKEAKRKLEELKKNGSNEGMISRRKVGQDGAFIRTDPWVESHKDNPETRNRILIKLEPGAEVESDLTWEGRSPITKGAKDDWYVIRLKDGRVGFSWSGNFLPGDFKPR